MSTTQKRAFLVLLAAGFVLCVRVVLPLWVPVFLGLGLTLTVAPWYEAACARHPRRRRLLAAACTLAALIVATLVIGMIVFVVVRELLPLVARVLEELRAHGIQPLYRTSIGRSLAYVGLDEKRMTGSLSRASGAAAGHAAQLAPQVLSMTTSSLLGVFFTGVTAYYLLVDGQRLLSWGERLSPLPREQTRALYREFHDVMRGTLIGTGVTALFQGGTGLLGYWIFRVPHPLVWGAITGLGSLVPGLGTTLVWVPASIVLIATGHVASGIGVIIFSAVVVVGVADYVVRPRVVGGQVHLHSLLVFIAIFGGMEAFGLMGLVLGPLFIALFVALLRIYDREYRAPRSPSSMPGGGALIISSA